MSNSSKDKLENLPTPSVENGKASTEEETQSHHRQDGEERSHIQPLLDDSFLPPLQDASADFFEAFGFKANLGRIWVTLFYSLQPLTQRELIKILQLSTGMVSQGLNTLIRLGVVHALQEKHGREIQYAAERNLAKAASLILGQREAQTISRLLERVEAIQFDMTVQSSHSPDTDKRLQSLEELIAILQLAQSIVALFGTFSRYSYHAMRLGVRALKHLRVIDLPQWLGSTVKRAESARTGDDTDG